MKGGASRVGGGLILLLLLIYGVMLFLGVANRTKKQEEKVFDMRGFYSGEAGEATNPKELYNKLYANVLAADGVCHSTMTKAVNVQMTENGIYWIAEGDAASAEELNVFTFKPYGGTNMQIVSPADMKFINSNVSVNEDGEMYIEARVGTRYIIQWSPVATWWCHIGKQNKNKHTSIYGNGGAYASVTAGWIIGEATEDTEVRMWKIEENGSQVQIRLSDYFY